MDLSTQEIWQKFVTQLADLATAGQFDKNNQVICFSGTTLMVDLANADAGISNYNIYNIGNIIPKWSSAYAPNSDLIGSYSTFLNYINLGGDSNPNLDSQINIVAGKMTAAKNNFSTQTKNSLTDWATMKEAMPNLTWATYIQQYGAVYTEAKATLDSAQFDYQNLLQKKSGVDYQSLLNAQSRVGFSGGARDIISDNSYNMKGKVGTEAPLGSTEVLPGVEQPSLSSSLSEILLPSYNLDGFKTAYQEWQTKSVNNKVDVGPIEVKGDSTASQFSEFGWSASVDASFFGDFFSFFGSGSASGKTIKSSWQSTTFDFKVSFTGLQTFKIEPLLWFQQSFITNYKNKLYPNAPQFFTENGSLSLLPYELIVGFEPKLELTLDNKDYQDVKSSFQTQSTASIGIGPFRIGKASFSCYGSKDDIQYIDKSNTIIIGPIKSTLPLLLGVICSKL